MSVNKPTLIVLAAGMGSRYGGLKQIEPVGPSGELIIDYSIYDALQAGFGTVVFVINEDIEEVFRRTIGQRIERRCETLYVFQKLDVPSGFSLPPGRVKPWGTAHATLSCRSVVHTPFAVINADDFYGRSAYQALSAHLAGTQDRAGQGDHCMVGYPLENTLTEHGHVARGICTVDPQGYLVEIHERTRISRFDGAIRYTEDGQHWVDVPRDTTASMNIWGFTPDLFDELEARFPLFLEANRHNLLKAEFFLPEVVGDLIREKRATVKVLPANDRWFGVTYQEDRSRVKQAIQNLIRGGVYPERLWQDSL
jgi:NDP-sugar pyrophosphorylase family protein